MNSKQPTVNTFIALLSLFFLFLQAGPSYGAWSESLENDESGSGLRLLYHHGDYGPQSVAESIFSGAYSHTLTGDAQEILSVHLSRGLPIEKAYSEHLKLYYGDGLLGEITPEAEKSLFAEVKAAALLLNMIIEWEMMKLDMQDVSDLFFADAKVSKTRNVFESTYRDGVSRGFSNRRAIFYSYWYSGIRYAAGYENRPDEAFYETNLEPVRGILLDGIRMEYRLYKLKTEGVATNIADVAILKNFVDLHGKALPDDWLPSGSRVSFLDALSFAFAQSNYLGAKFKFLRAESGLDF